MWCVPDTRFQYKIRLSVVIAQVEVNLRRGVFAVELYRETIATRIDFARRLERKGRFLSR